MDEIDDLFSVLASNQTGKKKRLKKKPQAAGTTVKPNPTPPQHVDSTLPGNVSHLSMSPATGVVCLPLDPHEDKASLPLDASLDHVPAHSLAEHQFPATSPVPPPEKAAVPVLSDSLAGAHPTATLHGSRLLRDMFAKVPPETVESRLARPLLIDVTRDRRCVC